MATGDFPPAQPPTAGSVLGLWFGVRDSVGPVAYGVSGLFLIALKYTVEAAVIWSTSGALYLPWHFLHRIHGRVLRHIQEMSEGSGEPAFHRTRQRVQ